MTTRLLSQSGQAPGRDTIHEALAAASLAAVDVAGASLSIGSLPLFRNAAGGGLEQVVRVCVGPASAQLDRIVLSGPDGTVAEAAGPVPGSGDLDLFVPELATPETWRVSAVLAGVSHTAAVTLTPQRKLTVHLVHHSHLDIGYTDTQGIVLRNHLEYLDAAVELGRQDDGSDSSTRFRWAIESNFPVRTWIAERSEATVKEFARLAQEDVLEVAAMPFNLHTEAATQEELARLLRTTIELRERYGIPILSAMHTDVPGATPGWVDALWEAGVRYLSAAHNWAGRSVPYYVGGQELGRPFWWRTPAGSKLLTWFTDSAHGMAYMEGNLVGLSESYERVSTLLPLYLSALTNRPFPYSESVFGLAGIPDEYELTKRPYPHDIMHLRVQGDHSDNACPNIRPSEIARRWNDQWAYPRLVTSTNTGFFTRAEHLIGDQLETHTGDWGDWWADGIGSGARPLGYNRRAQNLVRAGETVHLLADLRSGEPHPVRDAVDAIYDKVGLFDEHTWGAANPWHDHEHGASAGGLQWARKSEFAHQAHDDAQDLVHAAVRRLGAALTPRPDGLASLTVHNTTGRARTDLVQVFVPESVVDVNGSLVAVDARTGRQVPTRSTARAGWQQAASPRGRLVEFVATDVPATGWVRYDLVAAVAEPAATVERAEPLRLRNEFFEVTYDSQQALVSSIVDLRTGRELVNTGALTGVNEYVYDTYGTAPHVNHLSSRVQARDLSLFTSRAVGRNAVVLRAETTPLGEELEVEVHAPGVDWIRTTISLLRGVPRVDIVNRISKRASATKESVYFAFPLAGSESPAAFELSGSVDGRGVPHVPGAPQHMRAIRHWVGLRDSDGDYTSAWATLEAPLVQFETIHLPYQPFPSTISPDVPEPSTIYSWTLNNIWDTNFPAQQQGEMTFRYAISGSPDEPPHRLGPATATGLTDPLVGVLALADGSGPAVVAEGSLLSVDHPDVVLTSLGHPLDGSPGVAVRLRSLASAPVSASLVLGGYAASTAQLSTLLELEPSDVPVVDGRVTVEIPPGASRTVVLRP